MRSIVLISQIIGSAERLGLIGGVTFSQFQCDN